MDGDTNNYSRPSATDITGDWQKSSAPVETVSRLLFSSDYTRKVTRTTDIAGRLPNAVYTLPPRLVQAIVGLAEVTDATREALVAECKKFYLASREYEESKEVFVDGRGDYSTKITLDCGRLYAEGYNRCGQCGVGSDEKCATGARLIRLPPVLRVWHREGSWIAKTTRGLFAWGMNDDGRLGVGDNQGVRGVRQPRRVLIDGDILDVSIEKAASFFRTDPGWFSCGKNSHGQLGLGHTKNANTPALIPGSEGVTRWGGDYETTFGFSDDGLLACGENVDGKGGVGSTDFKIKTLTPVALPDDVKGRVDRVVCHGGSSFFIAGRRCFASGPNRHSRLGLGSDEAAVHTPTELPVPVDDVITNIENIFSGGLSFIRSGDTLLACGDNTYRQISDNTSPKFPTPIPVNLPGPVERVIIENMNIFVQLTDGAWVGRGRYVSDYFISVPDTDLIGFYHSRVLPGWTPVTDEYAEMFSRQEVGGQVMVLPEPITNNQESYDGIHWPSPRASRSTMLPCELACIAI